MSVMISYNGHTLHGDLAIPLHPKAIVLFAHGSGSSRKSPRNKMVASYLNEKGYATLLMDLLTIEEEEKDQVDASYRFNIPLLADRMIKVAQWVMKNRLLKEFPIALFGASTGAAAALIAAASLSPAPFAVISRGGRPDLAITSLQQVKSPTLLIVGERDGEVITLNQEAQDYLLCESDLVLIPGATHLFEEHGCLEKVCKHTADWLDHHLHDIIRKAM